MVQKMCFLTDSDEICFCPGTVVYFQTDSNGHFFSQLGLLFLFRILDGCMTLTYIESLSSLQADLICLLCVWDYISVCLYLYRVIQLHAPVSASAFIMSLIHFLPFISKSVIFACHHNRSFLKVNLKCEH